VIIVRGQADLFEIIRALSPPRCLTGRLHSRQEQSDQNGYNRDHDQQFDQRETSALLTHR
jgi:hypothetical protein